MYREIDPEQITATARVLGQRIAERFPDSGLSRVSAELGAVAQESESRFERLRRPNWPIRGAVAAAIVLLLTIAISAAFSIRVQFSTTGLSDLVQGVEAAINDVIFLSVAVYFLITVESRLKRRIALAGLNELRSIAHIIDMHQLTK